MNKTNQNPSNSRKRLERGSDGKIAGVCDGLANYLDVDVTLIRIGVVVATLATGGALLVGYIIAWIIMPEANGAQAHEQTASNWRTNTDNTKLLAWAALLLAALIILPKFSLLPIGIWPLALIGFGVFLLIQRPEEPEIQSTVAPAPAKESKPEQRTDPQAPAEDASSLILTPVVISLLSVGLGVGLLGHLNDWWTLSLMHGFAIILLGCGTGLLLSAFIGKAPGLIAIGALAAIGMAASIVLDPIIEDGAGQRTYRVSDITELQSDYRLGAGELILDFRDLNLLGTRQETAIHLTAGSLVIYLPVNVGVVVFGEAVAGEVSIAGQPSTDGIHAKDHLEVDGEGDAQLIIDAKVVFGEIEIIR